MRWFWIDRFVEFESGSRAVAVKNVSLAEEQLIGNLPGYPMMPHSLMIEGIAQTGGLLVGEHNQFQERVVLAKVGKAEFHGVVVPGETLTYTATVEDIKHDGAICYGEARVGDRLQANIELVFAHLDERFASDLFEPASFLCMLRMLGLYDVGKQADGSPLVPPPRLLAAEAAMFSTK